MKQISSLELHFLCEELKVLKNSRVDKIYNSGKEEIYIQLHKSNVGKKILKIIVGKAIFLTETKSVDEKPSGFVLFMRKHLEGKFLNLIEQLEPERIVKFIFRSKDETKKLYVESFGKGNVILCNDDDVIIDCLIRHKFKDRTILPKQKYQYPEMQYNLFALDKKDIVDLLKNSKKDKIVTSLAMELGLGGIYSEEVCLLSNIDKNLHPSNIDGKNIITIISSIKRLINGKINSQIIYKNKEAVDVVPIDLGFYKSCTNKAYSDYNGALNQYYTNELKIVKKEESAYEKKNNELKRIMDEQKDTIENMKDKENENRKKAELIYNNYQLIKNILDEINKASKKYSWKEIKDKLRGNKIVEDVDIKEKKIVIKIS